MILWRVLSFHHVGSEFPEFFVQWPFFFPSCVIFSFFLKVIADGQNLVTFFCDWVLAFFWSFLNVLWPFVWLFSNFLWLIGSFRAFYWIWCLNWTKNCRFFVFWFFFRQVTFPSTVQSWFIFFEGDFYTTGQGADFKKFGWLIWLFLCLWFFANTWKVIEAVQGLIRLRIQCLFECFGRWNRGVR